MFATWIRRRCGTRLTTSATTGLVLLVSSCTSSPQYGQFFDEATAVRAASSRGQQAAYEDEETAAAPIGVASTSGNAVQQTGLPSLPFPIPHRDHSGLLPHFIRTEPRITLPVEPMCPENCPAPYAMQREIPVPVYEPDVYPEEYICDGGDRNIKVYHDDFGRWGLDTEDTVAEFTDDAGVRRIRPSTRTCIYAPQFAAVRSASLPQVNLAVDRLAGAHRQRPSIGLRSHLTPGVELHNDQLIGLDRRSRASGIDHQALDSSVARVDHTAQHVKLNNLFENRMFLSRGQLDRTEEAYLAHAVQLAATWTRDQNPVIFANDAAGQEVVAEFHVEEYVGIEDKSRPGDLKIVKLVDESTAVAGDVVTFTIRYENVGDRDLYRIQIVDNLTPRLELLTETTQSDREGRFSVESNLEGSVVLTFELAEPLPGKTGGTLTFQCRVR